MKSKCDCCGWEGEPKTTFPNIPSLTQRLDPGGVSGEAEANKADTWLVNCVAVAEAAEALHRANQLEMGAVEMNKRWHALENALNAWRAAK